MWYRIATAALLSLVGCTRPAPSAGPVAATTAAPSTSIRAPRASRGTVDPAARAAPARRLEDVARADDTFDSLKARYGDAIERTALPVGEGQETPGWALYPDDSRRRIDIYPDDAGAHPASLYIHDGSTWTRADGVRLGLSTAELAALNGRPFVFSGFDWDYGGVVTDWKGGRLAPGGRAVGVVTLCAPDDAPADYPAGDAAYSSDLPVMKSHPARVCDFGLDLSTR